MAVIGSELEGGPTVADRIGCDHKSRRTQGDTGLLCVKCQKIRKSETRW